jgi:resuscitation-promoting factor RpfA
MTRPHVLHRPSVARSLLVGLVTTAAATALWRAPGPGTPPADVAGAVDWWSAAGTPAATITLVRLIALGAAVWGVCLTVLAVMVSQTRSVSATRAWRRLAPESLRRLMASSVIAAMAAVPVSVSAAGAAEPPPPRLTDLGPLDAEPGDAVSSGATLPVLIDLGPMPTTVEDPTDEPDVAASLWTVESGDHLWLVAEETLADRGLHPSEDDIARYWRRLIDDNRDLIGDDPDLIRPGMVLILPE